MSYIWLIVNDTAYTKGAEGSRLVLRYRNISAFARTEGPYSSVSGWKCIRGKYLRQNTTIDHLIAKFSNPYLYFILLLLPTPWTLVCLNTWLDCHPETRDDINELCQYLLFPQKCVLLYALYICIWGLLVLNRSIQSKYQRLKGTRRPPVLLSLTQY